jgi:hypothetical protein
MSAHAETFVKVNAAVDCGVAELVSALSDIDGLVTIESCEGQPGRAKAFVIFRFRDWRKCGEFLFVHLLNAMDDGLKADVAVSIDAYGIDNSLGRISASPEVVGQVASAVRNVRKCEYSGDRKHT